MQTTGREQGTTESSPTRQRGVAAVMSDAGPTDGAFHGHFTSKEDLVANVLADQLRAQRRSFDAHAPDRAGLEAFIHAYLSPQHRDLSDQLLARGRGTALKLLDDRA